LAGVLGPGRPPFGTIEQLANSIVAMSAACRNMCRTGCLRREASAMNIIL
jgi:hypothetical protein